MRELFQVLQIEWTLGDQILEASPKNPSQELNDQEERLESQGQGEIGVSCTSSTRSSGYLTTYYNNKGDL